MSKKLIIISLLISIILSIFPCATLAKDSQEEYVVELSTVSGAQIRTTGAQGLRFISSIQKSQNFDHVVEYGTVIIPSADISDIEELTIDTNLNGHSVAKVPAVCIYNETESTISFTAVLTNVKAKNYTRGYTARAYAIFDDGSVIYSDSYATRSIYTVAQNGLQSGNESELNKAVFQLIVDVVHSMQEEEPEILAYTLLEDGTYGVRAGKDISSQTTITIPAKHNGCDVTQILSNGFTGISTFERIILPDCIEVIGENAFTACSMLKTINFPENISFIGAYSFYSSGLVHAVFECTSNWELENKIKDTSLYGYTGISEWGISSKGTHGTTYWGPTYYSATCEISDPEIAANALTSAIKLPVYAQERGQEKRLSHTKTLSLYTENWIRK